MAALGLEAKNITKSFTHKGIRHSIFDQFSFSVTANSILTIVGPSGCGKSTLLKILAGLIDPEAGEIIWSKPLVETKIGYIPQKPSLMPNLTVLQNCVFLSEFARSPKAYEKRAQILLEQVGLEKFLYHYPSQISGGMKQKVALVRALLLEPDVLLMDEPFSAIDEMTRWQCDFDLRKLVAEHPVTIIFVTHNVEEAVAIADQIVCLSHTTPTQIVHETTVKFIEERNTRLLQSNHYWKQVNQLRLVLNSSNSYE